MKIAITAASGNLGRTIVESAVKKFGKENIIGLARNMEKAKDLGIEIRKGDYDKKDDLVQSLKGIEVVLLISSMAPAAFRLQQHKNVIDAAKENGVQRIVYTSIISNAEGTSFYNIVQSNRKTETYIKNSRMDYTIGRNGLYLDADIASVDHYIKEGKIENSAGKGKCAYITREELARAYTQILSDTMHNGKIYNLTGYNITQSELANIINTAQKTHIVYKDMLPEAYAADRIAAHGEFFGSIISGIYAAIRQGDFDVPSDFEKVMGRKHRPFFDYFT